MSSDCDKARDQLYVYLDSEITWWRRITVRRHLRRCVDCTDGFDFEMQLKTRIRQDCIDELPPELMSRVWSFIDEEQEAEGTGA